MPQFISPPKAGSLKDPQLDPTEKGHVESHMNLVRQQANGPFTVSTARLMQADRTGLPTTPFPIHPHPSTGPGSSRVRSASTGPFPYGPAPILSTANTAPTDPFQFLSLNRQVGSCAGDRFVGPPLSPPPPPPIRLSTDPTQRIDAPTLEETGVRHLVFSRKGLAVWPHRWWLEVLVVRLAGVGLLLPLPWLLDLPYWLAQAVRGEREANLL